MNADSGLRWRLWFQGVDWKGYTPAYNSGNGHLICDSIWRAGMMRTIKGRLKNGAWKTIGYKRKAEEAELSESAVEERKVRLQKQR